MKRRRRAGMLWIGLMGGAVASLIPAGAARAQWQEYGPGERYEAMRNYERHRELPKKKQKEIERQYQRWQQMSDDERQRIRKNYERFQKMPPAKQAEVENRSRPSRKKRSGD